jgi:hypothetical protein
LKSKSATSLGEMLRTDEKDEKYAMTVEIIRQIALTLIRCPDCAPFEITDSVLVSKISLQFPPASHGTPCPVATRRLGERNCEDVS